MKVRQEPHVRIQPRRGNKNPPLQTSEYIVGSMDVKALYPSCKKDKSAQKIEKAFIMADLDFRNLDRDFLVKVVSIVTRGNHQDQDIQQFLMKPKARTTLNSFIKRPS